ncbi:hypothetical protein [Undibacterium oligocarboniphilum]|uniref:hypothetical protein n=1 Tax=Undibacterium oligocarboniphilum TaxID=666702 RepID=UPI001688BA35|nr:hypothetical protein [Undibacterium oligocarboniphilum]MBC3871452.1 hypothetical protein [Undibacterium oligocarboniphilum]
MQLLISQALVELDPEGQLTVVVWYASPVYPEGQGPASVLVEGVQVATAVQPLLSVEVDGVQLAPE